MTSEAARCIFKRLLNSLISIKVVICAKVFKLTITMLNVL